MSIEGIQTSAAMLSYYQRLEQIAANNLANVATDGFKVMRIIATNQAGISTPVPVTQLDLSQGALRQTDRMLDLAIAGDGFFVVDVDGEEMLTRAGGLRVNDAGLLVDPSGAPVLGQSGAIAVNGGRLDVRADGLVLVNGQEVDRLRIEGVDDPANLSLAGGNHFRAAAGTVAVDPASTEVMQYAIEESNQNAVQGMVDLVEIQRSYMANLKAMRAMDEVLGTIANSVGSTD